MAHAPFTTPFRFNSAKRRQLTTPSHHPKVHTKYQDHLLGHSLRIAKGVSADVQSISLSLVPLGQCIQPTAARRNEIPPVAQKSFDRFTCTCCHRRSLYLSCASATSSLISLSPQLASLQCMSNIFALLHSMYRNTITPLQLMLVELPSGLHEFEIVLQRGSA